MAETAVHSTAGTTEDTNLYRRLIDIGIALSAERNLNRLMEMILLEAKAIGNADGGTLYIRTDDDKLRFEIMRTDSLNIALGGTTGKPIAFPPLNLFDPSTGQPNHRNVASHSALAGTSVNIPDAYEAKDFDFSGTRKFDEGTGYRSKSFLTVPLRNSQNAVIGVLQLLNARDRKTGDVIPFGADVQPVIEALASQAAVALDNSQLLVAQKKLLDSFIELIAGAIDAKSPYTGGHCQRVPELTKMLARAACDAKEGPFQSFDMTEDQWYELHLGAYLHDCGKVTTPEYIVDKATKLETIYDRIHEVRTRFEVIKRDVVIEYLKALRDEKKDSDALRAEMEARLAQIDDDFAFIAECNIGGEFMAPEKVERVKKIAAVTWKRTLDDRIGVAHEELKRMERAPAAELPVDETLLSDKEHHVFPRPSSPYYTPDNRWGFKMDVPKNEYNRGEVYNLCIGRGTLTAEDRFKINEHMVQTIRMLGELPFPKHLKSVPEYAGAHHETLIGTGYPRRLKKEDMSIPARAMAIADIFEALTAADRPYKKAKTLSESIKILYFFKKDQHVDPDLFDLFLTSGIYMDYANKFLRPEQIDTVDIAQYLGPIPPPKPQTPKS
ncbi:MAG: GAF domain-containing protein [Alphaproteobacteria bacterium]|nr:GAF domain-containing protein [Alphaproteobacteria bacterium]